MNTKVRANRICKKRSEVSSDRDLLQTAWQSMRVLRRFTISQLLVTSDIEGRTPSYNYLTTYLRMLRNYDYIRKIPGQIQDSIDSRSVFQLVKNSGPIRPFKYSGGLFDCNTNIHWKLFKGVPTPLDIYDQEITDVDEYVTRFKEAKVPGGAHV